MDDNEYMTTGDIVDMANMGCDTRTASFRKLDGVNIDNLVISGTCDDGMPCKHIVSEVGIMNALDILKMVKESDIILESNDFSRMYDQENMIKHLEKSDPSIKQREYPSVIFYGH